MAAPKPISVRRDPSQAAVRQRGGEQGEDGGEPVGERQRLSSSEADGERGSFGRRRSPQAAKPASSSISSSGVRLLPRRDPTTDSKPRTGSGAAPSDLPSMAIRQ
ncbi:hypothetical protein ACLOJK_037921 [Asimina triloba]